MTDSLMLGTTHGLRSTSHITVHHLRAQEGPGNTHKCSIASQCIGPDMLSCAHQPTVTYVEGRLRMSYTCSNAPQLITDWGSSTRTGSGLPTQTQFSQTMH